MATGGSAAPRRRLHAPTSKDVADAGAAPRGLPCSRCPDPVQPAATLGRARLAAGTSGTSSGSSDARRALVVAGPAFAADGLRVEEAWSSSSDEDEGGSGVRDRAPNRAWQAFWTQRLTELADAGRRLFEERQYSGAAQCYGEVIRAVPGWSEPHLRRSMCHCELELWDATLADAKAFLALPHDAALRHAAYFLVARALCGLGDPEAAVEWADAALAHGWAKRGPFTRAETLRLAGMCRRAAWHAAAGGEAPNARRQRQVAAGLRRAGDVLAQKLDGALDGAFVVAGTAAAVRPRREDTGGATAGGAVAGRRLSPEPVAGPVAAVVAAFADARAALEAVREAVAPRAGTEPRGPGADDGGAADWTRELLLAPPAGVASHTALGSRARQGV
ncbi:unnamed protein product [Pedinophyceae sp. YPF-701]|nr:unnamed protein product [Pedinophyceae sp. YPF-701]